MNNHGFSPGNLVRARGREWVIQPWSEGGTLSLRPLGGTDDDIQIILPDLESEPVVPATFPPPDPDRPGAYDSALLLRDALRLKLRSGAGPFRSFGRIAVEPRAYQLVPLLMALKQSPVRLLIADDVGIGKTIEAALIVRELLDRAEIRRFAVLCPPHLVDQWQKELADRFHIHAAALTASSVARLEREVPSGVSLFVHFPAVVVSLDYIKIDRHRAHFLADAPEMIVVDEAHTCTRGGQAQQLRYKLLRDLVADPERHLVMLTATPHSGDDVAFHNLLSLLDSRFAALASGTVNATDPLRIRLAEHFVQRRRVDIDEWKDPAVFPRRMTKEITYILTGGWKTFFDEVRAYCLGLATRAEAQKTDDARMIWYATLALLRCVASSPAAAHNALTTKLAGTPEEMAALADDDKIDDGDADDLRSNDAEPPAALEDSRILHQLIQQADALRGASGDPKLTALQNHIDSLLKDSTDSFHPVVFCRYIATAHYVADELKKRFPEATVDCITGEYSPEEREERIGQLILSDLPMLVATDCLSEGVNLQHGFNAVVHYDLAWNPTRHEQREGRVDRFGQTSREVRCAMIYGQNNPVDGFILNVILRKAKAIRDELGVLVPMPGDGNRIRLALVKAALMRPGSGNAREQGTLDFGDELAPLESAWRDALERVKANRTLFAQRGLKPQDVMPEWNRQAESLGRESDVQRFVQTALFRLNAPLEPLAGESFRLLSRHLPSALRERLAVEGIESPYELAFSCPTGQKGDKQKGDSHKGHFVHRSFVHRSHPLVSLLAEQVLESALSDSTTAATDGIPLASRCSAFETESVNRVTNLFLLRLRHQLDITRKGRTRELMAEESIAIAFAGRAEPEQLSDTEAERLLDAHPSGNLSRDAMTYNLREALLWYKDHRELFEEIAKKRAQSLLSDHRRVRDAAGDRGQYAVRSCLPVDLIGVYVLLPASL